MQSKDFVAAGKSLVEVVRDAKLAFLTANLQFISGYFKAIADTMFVGEGPTPTGKFSITEAQLQLLIALLSITSRQKFFAGLGFQTVESTTQDVSFTGTFQVFSLTLGQTKSTESLSSGEMNISFEEINGFNSNPEQMLSLLTGISDAEQVDLFSKIIDKVVSNIQQPAAPTPTP